MTAGVTRRRLLAGGGAAALVAGACSDGAGGPADPDLDVARDAAGMERLAFDHYVSAGRLMTDGKVGALVPQALAALVATAAGHHDQAHRAWNTLLAGAGRGEVTAAPAKLQEALNAAAIRQTDVLALASLALRIEDYAAQTYLQAVPDLRRPEAVQLAAQLAIAGHQRQAVLRYLLGREPVAPARADPQLRLISG
jgi:hypothetical protein